MKLRVLNETCRSRSCGIGVDGSFSVRERRNVDNVGQRPRVRGHCLVGDIHGFAGGDIAEHAPKVIASDERTIVAGSARDLEAIDIETDPVVLIVEEVDVCRRYRTVVRNRHGVGDDVVFGVVIPLCWAVRFLGELKDRTVVGNSFGVLGEPVKRGPSAWRRNGVAVAVDRVPLNVDVVDEVLAELVGEEVGPIDEGHRAGFVVERDVVYVPAEVMGAVGLDNAGDA